MCRPLPRRDHTPRNPNMLRTLLARWLATLAAWAERASLAADPDLAAARAARRLARENAILRDRLTRLLK
jgi:hypothetical protein